MSPGAQTRALRLDAFGRHLSTWCSNETYYSDKWVYSWSQSEREITEGPDVGETEYTFTVRVGFAPHNVLTVTGAELDDLPTVEKRRGELEATLKPLQVPEARKAEMR